MECCSVPGMGRPTWMLLSIFNQYFSVYPVARKKLPDILFVMKKI